MIISLKVVLTCALVAGTIYLVQRRPRPVYPPMSRRRISLVYRAALLMWLAAAVTVWIWSM